MSNENDFKSNGKNLETEPSWEWRWNDRDNPERFNENSFGETTEEKTNRTDYVFQEKYERITNEPNSSSRVASARTTDRTDVAQNPDLYISDYGINIYSNSSYNFEPLKLSRQGADSLRPAGEIIGGEIAGYALGPIAKWANTLFKTARPAIKKIAGGVIEFTEDSTTNKAEEISGDIAAGIGGYFGNLSENVDIQERNITKAYEAGIWEITKRYLYR